MSAIDQCSNALQRNDENFVTLIQWVMATRFLPNVKKQDEIRDIHYWDHRCSQVLDVLNKERADIICLQQLRDLDDAKYSAMYIPKNLDDMYATHMFECDAYRCTFHLLIAYNRHKFFVDDVDIIPYVDDVHHTQRRIAAGLKLVPKNKSPAFWVYTTHIHLCDDLKERSVDILVDRLSKKNMPIVFAGDLNLYLGKKGKQQYQALVNGMHEKGVQFNDMTYPLFIQDGANELALRGTFFGYPYDDNVREVVVDSDGVMQGLTPLDHVFGSRIVQLGFAQVVGMDAQEVLNKTTLSDHVGIKTCFIVQTK